MLCCLLWQVLARPVLFQAVFLSNLGRGEANELQVLQEGDAAAAAAAWHTVAACSSDVDKQKRTYRQVRQSSQTHILQTQLLCLG